MLFALTLQFFNALEITLTNINVKYALAIDILLGLAIT